MKLHSIYLPCLGPALYVQMYAVRGITVLKESLIRFPRIFFNYLPSF
jgi:hypothetical protein